MGSMTDPYIPLEENLQYTRKAIELIKRYGFGFTAYTLYMIYFAQGKYPTAHFAISTAFMSLGMMLPGMVSGYIQQWIGYENFFIWVMICTAVTFIVSAFIKIDPAFGKK